MQPSNKLDPTLTLHLSPIHGTCLSGLLFTPKYDHRKQRIILNDPSRGMLPMDRVDIVKQFLAVNAEEVVIITDDILVLRALYNYAQQYKVSVKVHTSNRDVQDLKDGMINCDLMDALLKLYDREVAISRGE